MGRIELHNSLLSHFSTSVSYTVNLRNKQVHRLSLSVYVYVRLRTTQKMEGFTITSILKNLAKKWKKNEERRSESRGKSMKEIQLHVEQVSKQSFIEGWAKAEPSIVNQIRF